MNFGSDEFKELIIQAYNNPQMYREFMSQLYAVVKEYTEKKLDVGFQPDQLGKGSKGLCTQYILKKDYDDIVQNVFFNVTRNFDKFVIKMDMYTEAQRQAWLRVIVYRCTADYIKKSMAGNVSGDSMSPDALMTDPFGIDGHMMDYETAEILRKMIRVVTSFRSKPQKIMAFVYNAVIFFHISGHKKNCDAIATCNFMNEKSYHRLKELMIKLIEILFRLKLSNDDIMPLPDILGSDFPTERGMEVCNVTEKDVTDWTNRIRTKLFMFREAIYGKEDI